MMRLHQISDDDLVWRKHADYNKTEKDIPAEKCNGETFEGTGSNVKDERKDYTDKADPILEHDCIWCMACVSVCPPQTIKVDQANVDAHAEVTLD